MTGPIINAGRSERVSILQSLCRQALSHDSQVNLSAVVNLTAIGEVPVAQPVSHFYRTEPAPYKTAIARDMCTQRIAYEIVGKSVLVSDSVFVQKRHRILDWQHDS
jgi:hypothetical protein